MRAVVFIAVPYHLRRDQNSAVYPRGRVIVTMNLHPKYHLSFLLDFPELFF